MKLPVKLSGKVTKFKGDGRRLGYPTANIHSHTKLDDGIYFGTASMGLFDDNPALIFVGTPTTMGETERRVEAYLLDVPDQDYYGETLELNVQKFWRKNKKFNSVDELIDQIKMDEEAIRTLV